ncbi:MAG: DUF4097 domain-containing protein [Thermosynechococcaceae cyanobacterium MS004]|nr:DUF4097 domain-containing protein [Thermosynechococcaceae cyanobacterium MS004]
MNTNLFLALLVPMVGSSWVFSESSQASNRTCQGSLGQITVENLSVANNGTCRLNGTRVKGNLFVGSNAALIASELRLSGNLQAKSARQVDITFFSNISGNIEIQRSRSVNIAATKIEGNLELTSNLGNIRVFGNQVQGNVEVIQSSGSVSIHNNRIDGNLICKGNQPQPRGQSNVVKGNKENQCSRL